MILLYTVVRNVDYPRGTQTQAHLSQVFMCVFLLPGVTILLSLTVFLNMVAETMPATSDAVPLLGKPVCHCTRPACLCLGDRGGLSLSQHVFGVQSVQNKGSINAKSGFNFIHFFQIIKNIVFDQQERSKISWNLIWNSILTPYTFLPIFSSDQLSQSL